MAGSGHRGGDRSRGDGLVDGGRSGLINGSGSGLVDRSGDWGSQGMDGGGRFITTVGDICPARIGESVLAFVLEEWVAAACCYVMMKLQRKRC